MKIRQASMLIGALEAGELDSALTEEMQRVAQTLREMSLEDMKKTFKGEVKVTLSLAAENGAVTISAEFNGKTPKQPRQRTFYWITEDGAFSTEHPHQTDMFSGPRVTGQRAHEA